jgi:hypothetical protein
VRECDRGSTERRRRRPSSSCKGYVACLALGWEGARADVGATLQVLLQGSAIEVKQGKAGQTGYGKVAGWQAEGERTP